jgi:tRNA pseudouridine38-40 synthase
MRNFKLTIEYDGGRYLGWQKLGDSDKTIQGKIERAIARMTGAELELIGSGRTDGGTHARAQVANFKSNTQMHLKEIQDYLNEYLPRDIVITDIEEAAERFHARYNAKAKRYSYYIHNSHVPSAFDRNYSYHYAEKLDMDLMKQAAKKLTGTHDYIGFSALKKSKKSTERTVSDINIHKEGKMLHFTFVGDGFLYKMVRIMMGTILEIGEGTRDLSSIDEVFNNKIRSEAGETLPAQGLFLDEVYYN